MAFLTITHSLSKLNRLVTFDNVSLPFSLLPLDRPRVHTGEHDPPAQRIFMLLIFLASSQAPTCCFPASKMTLFKIIFPTHWLATWGMSTAPPRWPGTGPFNYQWCLLSSQEGAEQLYSAIAGQQGALNTSCVEPSQWAVKMILKLHKVLFSTLQQHNKKNIKANSGCTFMVVCRLMKVRQIVIRKFNSTQHVILFKSWVAERNLHIFFIVSLTQWCICVTFAFTSFFAVKSGSYIFI